MSDAPASSRIWANINAVIEAENLGETIATIVGGVSQLIMRGLNITEEQARAHLAAICLSPAGRPIGALEPALKGELVRLRDNS